LNGVNTDIILATFVATIVLLILGSFGIIITIIYKKKQYAHLSEKRKIQAAFQEQLLQSQLEIKEQTLQHIAYELHDNLGQIASLIKINLNTIQLDDKLKANQKIDDTRELVRQLIADLKSISVSLNSDRVVQLGIVKSVEDELERLNKIGQIETMLRIEGVIPAFDASTSTIIYRMVQEVLNNTVKHSGAKRIEFTLRASKNLFTLVCSDDGVGFNIEEKSNSAGSGLLNLKSRAKLIHADLTIQSSPANGTTVSIELPI